MSLNIYGSKKMQEPLALRSTQITKDVANGEAFAPVVNEDIYEYALLPTLRAIRRQIFGGDCSSPEEEANALAFLKSKAGDKLRACLYDYTALELMKKSEKLSKG